MGLNFSKTVLLSEKNIAKIRRVCKKKDISFSAGINLLLDREESK